MTTLTDHNPALTPLKTNIEHRPDLGMISPLMISVIVIKVMMSLSLTLVTGERIMIISDIITSSLRPHLTLSLGGWHHSASVGGSELI